MTKPKKGQHQIIIKNRDTQKAISRLPTILSTVAIVISGISALFSYQQFSLASKIAHLHIDPTMKYSMSYYDNSIKKRDPKLFITNVSSLPVSSLSFYPKIFMYNHKTNIITSTIELENAFLDSFGMIEELPPGKTVVFPHLPTMDLNKDISVYLFEVKYYRKSDMKEYTDLEYFFVDDNTLYSRAEYNQIRPVDNIIKIISEKKSALGKSDYTALDDRKGRKLVPLNKK